MGPLAKPSTGYCLTRPVEATTSEGYGVCWQEQLFLVHSDVYETPAVPGSGKAPYLCHGQIEGIDPTARSWS